MDLRLGVTALLVAGCCGCSWTRVAPIASAHFAPVADERALWEGAEAADRALAASGVVLEDPDLHAYLDEIARQLLPHLGAPGVEVRLFVLKDPLLNAFALPNGSLYLHSGVLAAIENEAQAAVIIGHELAHYLRRHSLRERRSERNRLAIARVVVGIVALGVAAGGDSQLVMQVLHLGNDVAKDSVSKQIQGYARDLEREADRLALEAMVAAGYDAAEAEVVFQALRIQAQEGQFGEPYFFGSHPLLSERIANTREFADDVPSLPDAVVGRGRYTSRVAGLLLTNAELDLAIGRPHRARAAVERHLRHNPESARGHLLHGQVQRRIGDDPAQLASAADAFAAAIRFAPDNAVAHRELALVDRARGQRDGARQGFRRFLELSPDAIDRPIIESYLEELE